MKYIKAFIKKILKYFGYEVRLYRTFVKKNKYDINQIIQKDVRNIHYGCGPVLFKEWLNVDLQPKTDKDYLTYSMDLIEKHPFADNYFKFAFSEDFIEHLTQPQSLLFLVEVYRTLQLGGVLRLSFPGFENNLKGTYSEISYEHFYKSKFECYEQWGHLHLYSKDEISYLLKHLGFKDVNFVEYGKSSYFELSELDTRAGQVGANTYIEAVK